MPAYVHFRCRIVHRWGLQTRVWPHRQRKLVYHSILPCNDLFKLQIPSSFSTLPNGSPFAQPLRILLEFSQPQAVKLEIKRKGSDECSRASISASPSSMRAKYANAKAVRYPFRAAKSSPSPWGADSSQEQNPRYQFKLRRRSARWY